ncbi:hypothetical protein [Pseudoramibacter alactolyticus]|nr:hypothetical protein [Pseudoramibacter alactolyticus]
MFEQLKIPDGYYFDTEKLKKRVKKGVVEVSEFMADVHRSQVR